jgi:hypothetical protein
MPRKLSTGRTHLDILEGELLDLVEQAVAEALGEGRAAGEDDVGEERLAEVEVGAVDRVDDDLVDAGVLLAVELWVEKDLGGAEAFGAELSAAMWIGEEFSGGKRRRTLTTLPSGNRKSSPRAPPAASFSSLAGLRAT